VAGTSDEKGAFRLRSLPPGRYRLFVEANGYLRHEYGSLKPGRPGVEFHIAPNEEKDLGRLQLIPQAVIAGRVRDGSGASVPMVRVRVMRAGFDHRGPTLRAAGVPIIGAVTDDLGRFRIGGLAPGSYYVVADHQPASSIAEKIRTASGEANERFITTFFPSAATLASATAVQVAAAQSVDHLTIELLRRPAFRVSGTLEVADRLASPNRFKLFLQPADSNSGMDLVSGLGVFPNPDGRFSAEKVPAGSYLLAVVSTGLEVPFVLTRQPLDLGKEDVENLRVFAHAPLEVRGAVELAGREGTRLPKNLTLRLVPELGPTLNPPQAIVQPNGEFVFTRVGREPFHVLLDGESDAYIQAVFMDGKELPGHRLDAAGGVQGRLAVRLGSDSGSITGEVRRKALDGPVAPGAIVVAVREPQNLRSLTCCKSAFADESGQFQLGGLPPGDYRIYAWQELDGDNWRNPMALSSVSSPRTVKVAPQSSLSVQRLITTD
jgi:hypothetical protein